MGFAEYMLKLNLAIIICWALYRTAFIKYTFFQWNRFYLIGSVVLSFILPLLRLPRGRRLAAAADFSGINWEFVDQLVMVPPDVVPGISGITPGFFLLLLYLAGTWFFLVSGMLSWLKVRKLTRSASCVDSGKVKVFVHNGPKASFTLFRNIYLDRQTWERRTEHILRHEMVHATQLHSADRLLMALVSMLLWFNPFVFLLLQYVRENHEYLADEPARSGPDTMSAYLACLRDETIRRFSPGIASQFKSSTIKKRIIMLTNHHTNNKKKLRYLTILPLIALILLAFQAPVDPVIETPARVLETLPGISSYAKAGEIPSLFPLPEQYRKSPTQEYGSRIHPITKKTFFHRGVDYAAPGGTPVFASAGGSVQEADFDKAWGNYVILDHDQGYSTRYTHLEGFSVKAGDPVRKGQQVAKVGTTGRSTGTHLHYEVWKDGEHVDPADYY